MPLPRRTRTHVPGSNLTPALRAPFLAPALINRSDSETVRTIPRPMEVPRASEMPQRRRRQRREVAPSLTAVGGSPPDESTVQRPTEVDGVTVVREERMRNYQGSYFKISKLYLADGVMVWGCWECLYVAETRGHVMAHRNAEHGAQYGKKGHRKARMLALAEQAAEQAAAEETAEPETPEAEICEPVTVVQPAETVAFRADRDTIPKTIMDMTIGGVRSLCDLVERLEKEIEDLKDKLDEVQIDRTTQHKIDVYETNRAEIVELRQIKSQHDHCDDLRDEVKELRAFRRKMITRMAQLGFKLSEEEN